MMRLMQSSTALLCNWHGKEDSIAFDRSMSLKTIACGMYGSKVIYFLSPSARVNMTLKYALR